MVFGTWRFFRKSRMRQSWQARFTKLILIVLCLVWGFQKWVYYRHGYESAEHLAGPPKLGDKTNLPTILLYTALDGSWDNWRWEFPDPLLSCPALETMGMRYDPVECQVTSDQASLDKAAVVLVSMADITSFTWTWMPPGGQRSEQIWALHFTEAPWFYSQRKLLDRESLSNLNGLFSWTVSYRKDSDFQGGTLFPSSKDYCRWTKTDPTETIEKETLNYEIISSKSDLVVWIVSHCNTVSKREDYVAQLQKYLNVTILGKCGALGRDKSAWETVKWSKFYLAFENSVCDEYITEKFHRILNSYNTVPVVLGPKKADYLRVAPPNSFIHVADFPGGPQELAQYLVHLDTHPAEYLAYLSWKTSYRAECPDTWSCRMCAALHQKPRPQVIQDFPALWDSTSCYSNWNHTKTSFQ